MNVAEIESRFPAYTDSGIKAWFFRTVNSLSHEKSLKERSDFSVVDIYPRISLNSDVFARQRAITLPKIQKVEYGACLCASKRDRGKATKLKEAKHRGNGGGEVLKLLRETGKIFEYSSEATRRSNYEFVGRKAMRVIASHSCTRLRRRDIEIGRLRISAAASSPWTRTNGWMNGWMRWDTVRKKLSGV